MEIVKKYWITLVLFCGLGVSTTIIWKMNTQINEFVKAAEKHEREIDSLLVMLQEEQMRSDQNAAMATQATIQLQMCRAGK